MSFSFFPLLVSVYMEYLTYDWLFETFNQDYKDQGFEVYSIKHYRSYLKSLYIFINYCIYFSAVFVPTWIIFALYPIVWYQGIRTMEWIITFSAMHKRYKFGY